VALIKPVTNRAAICHPPKDMELAGGRELAVRHTRRSAANDLGSGATLNLAGDSTLGAEPGSLCESA
jgi:hypothetical protein